MGVYEIWELLAIAGVFIAGGLVKGGIGLGLPTISMGLMVIWMPVEQAAGILILPAIITNIWQAWYGTALRLVVRRLWPLFVFVIIGSLAAAILIAEADTALAAGLLGAMLIIYAGLGLSGARFKVPVRSETALNPIIGILTGLISGVTAIFVIPVVPYLQSLDFSKGRSGDGNSSPDYLKATDETMIKDALVQSMGVTILICIGGLALGLGIRGELPSNVFVPGAIGSGAAIIGMVAGRLTRNRLSLEVFRRWILTSLVCLGAVMVIRTIT